MRPKQILLNIGTALALALLLPGMADAQDAATAPQAVTSSTNQVAILMLIIAAVLAFVIYALGQVLFTMGRQALDKSRKENKLMSVLLMIGFSLMGLTTQAQDAAATEAAQVLPNYGGLSATTFWMFFAVIITEVIVIFFMMFSIRRIQRELLPEEAAEKKQTFSRWWSEVDKKLFTRAVPVEKEADVMLDHDYDGIRELDNALPPWWKYGFYITIGVAFVYLMHYHVLGNGKNPTQEYEAEMAQAQAKAAVYAAKQVDKVDESNVQMPDVAGLEKGKELYASNCWACHGKLGEGGAGPNLTDDYWIHKGSLNDIYKSIKVGYPDKGMQAWEKNFSPKEISYLTGYIKKMRGTNPPNAKAPQGDLYEDAAASPAATDSSANAQPAPKADSTTTNAAKTSK